MCKNIIYQIEPQKTYWQNTYFIQNLNSSDIVEVVHTLFEQIEDLSLLKKGISKFLNLFHKAITTKPLPQYHPNSVLEYIQQNTSIVIELLNKTKSTIKQINTNSNQATNIETFRNNLYKIAQIIDIYTIKENILFPAIEKNIEKFKCIMVMWSVHDDVRNNIKTLWQITQNKQINLNEFNQIIGQLYFNIFTIHFRDKHLLFPNVNNYLPQQTQIELLLMCKQMPFPFINPDFSAISYQKNIDNAQQNNQTIDLETGNLTVEQIKLILNHLPTDITFVEHNVKVRYFSSP